MPPPPLHSRWRIVFMIASIIALLWTIGARVFGPSDIWHQTQPKTVSYTTDIIVNGGSHWVLPVERGELPATKPPLYNWLAVPAVKLMGFSSEVAHKFPSLLAMILCWAGLIGLGNRLDPQQRQLGWLAGLFFVTNYSIFKLGYLARPDMVLTLWLLLSWALSTHLLQLKNKGVGSLLSRSFTFALWICIALAGLTKGPPAVLILLYILLAAPAVGGSFRSIHRLSWWWGAPLCLGLTGLWIYGVWRIDPVHLRQELWLNEIYHRITGDGPNAPPGNVGHWFRELAVMPSYFMARFAPWSIAALLMLIWMAQRRPTDVMRHWRSLPDPVRPWLMGAMLYLVIVIVFFSLSSGKRADYIASTFGPASLLAAWWLLRAPPYLGRRMPWLIPCVAVITLSGLTYANQRQYDANEPMPGFVDNIQRFIEAARLELDRQPAEVAFIWTRHSHFKAFLGYSDPDSLETIQRLTAQCEPFWIIAGRRKRQAEDFAAWYATRNPDVELTAVLRSDDVPEELELRLKLHERGWPEQMTLFRAVPISPFPDDESTR